MTDPSLPSDADILDRLARIVAASLRIDPARVKPGTRLDELGAESIDLLEIAMEVEHEFSILWPERTILEAGTEVLGEGVLVHDGRLTAEGRRLLQSRMPELDAAGLPPEPRVAEVAPLFLRVDVWVRLIGDLLQRSPRACPSCAGPLRQGSPGRLSCPACATEHELPSGDDLSRAWVREYARARGLPLRAQ